MLETQNRHESKEITGLDQSSGRHSYKGNSPGSSVEDKIKSILIKNTESYEGVGERMIQTVRDLLSLFQEFSQIEVDLLYDAISRILVEFIATQPFKTGIFAGVTALFSTSLTNDSPLSTHSNLTTRILELSIKRFTYDLSKSNYYSCQLILNFFTEMANFYIIDLNQLVSIYRAILNTSLSLKKLRSNSSHKYLVSDHHSFILFTLIAYALPLIREEMRNPESENQNQTLYHEILKDATLFYDTYMVEYCEETQKILLNLVGKDLLKIQSVENPFTKYWNSFLRWREQQSPRIMTILRFYRSSSISDYLSEILSPPKDFNFEEAFSNLELGEINEYLSKQLVRFPSINTLEIGDFILLRTMDTINEIFVQSPYETARQLLKLPVTSPSYDLCLSITIWNYLLNPFYVCHLSFINSLVINLVKLQSSFFVTIWTPIFILNMQPCKDLISENSPRSQEMVDSELETGNLSQKQNCTIEDSNNPMIGEMINHLVFPHIKTFSMGMLFRLKKHIIYVFSSNDIFQSSPLKESFWNSNKTEFLFKTEIHDQFLNGFLDSVLAGMSRIMLSQTLLSIPNENLNLRINKFPFLGKNSSKAILPAIFLKLKEFAYLKEILVFKFTTKDEITEKNCQIKQFLESKIGKLNDQEENEDDIDEDLQVSRRYEERQFHKEESKEEDMSQNHGDQDKNSSKDAFKSSKKRRINSIHPQEQFTWTKDSLFDLLLISIIDQGSKSPSHTKRLFANYKTSLLGWYGGERNDLSESNESDCNNTLSCGQHYFSDQVSHISNGILNYNLFRSSAKQLVSNEDDSSAAETSYSLADHPNIKTEIRLISVILTIWGGLLNEDPSISLGFNFQKLKSLIIIAIGEGVLSPGLASISFACILTCIQSPSCLDISLNKSGYQIFSDLFELILEILEGMKARELAPGSSAPEDSKESEMNDRKRQSDKLSNSGMEKCVLALICILKAGSKTFGDRQVDEKIQILMEDSATEIFLRFGSTLIEAGASPRLDLESIQGEYMAQLLKDFKDLSLEFALNFNDPSLKLELRWVSSSVINRRL
ncbi:uncharacterized protein ELE39_000863 [Cryptosporidium sp. chipmunk genotype I]|uniref:uncharacterized protein n=1 Tax=Cryptosporidium sp. chipmunk genotype I TaxID=1280935 RepID=UPI00351A582C|nr:hypothetical protein ELE39_000863 [Cryptosporidium sp. chipmunk genotype I]